MIHHSFHIDSFSTTVEFTCISLTTTCYLKFFSRFDFPPNCCLSRKPAKYSYKQEQLQ